MFDMQCLRNMKRDRCFWFVHFGTLLITTLAHIWRVNNCVCFVTCFGSRNINCCIWSLCRYMSLRTFSNVLQELEDESMMAALDEWWDIEVTNPELVDTELVVVEVPDIEFVDIELVSNEPAPTVLDPDSPPISRTVSESSSSVIHPTHCWRQPLEIAEAPQVWCDTLLDEVQQGLDQPERRCTLSLYESWDTEDTAREDFSRPPPAPLPSLPLHWSEQPVFQSQYNDMLDLCWGQWWFEGVLDNLTPPLNFTLAFQHALTFIRYVQSLADTYMIGITANPWHRFIGPQRHAYVRDPRHNFKHFKVIWIARYSHKWKPESSGLFETMAVVVFNRLTCLYCLNQEDTGGECPAAGPVQFVYIVW